MIVGFRCKATRRIFCGLASRAFPSEVQRIARRKLAYLNAATELGDLCAPPGNRLEKLSGTRQGEYSIRVNDQWRICFTWNEGSADSVEMVDYH
jgi:proteic killer suppression protein